MVAICPVWVFIPVPVTSIEAVPLVSGSIARRRRSRPWSGFRRWIECAKKRRVGVHAMMWS